MRSARVDLPWSMWAMMEKLRMLFINKYKNELSRHCGAEDSRGKTVAGRRVRSSDVLVQFPTQYKKSAPSGA
jgi:hypothetical protein